jgi:hypothetical protein
MLATFGLYNIEDRNIKVNINNTGLIITNKFDIFPLRQSSRFRPDLPATSKTCWWADIIESGKFYFNISCCWSSVLMSASKGKILTCLLMAYEYDLIISN